MQGLCPFIPNIMVNYLRQQVWGSKPINTTESSTAYCVLDRLHDCFVKPRHWRQLRNSMQGHLFYEERTVQKTILHERRTDIGEHTDVIVIEDALVQLQAERLSATRSTLYRWAHTGQGKGSLLRSLMIRAGAG